MRKWIIPICILSIFSSFAGAPYDITDLNESLRIDGFLLITDVKTDQNGNIYVLDSVRATILVYDENGSFIRKIGSNKYEFLTLQEYMTNYSQLLEKSIRGKEIKDYELVFPTSFALDEERVFILDGYKIVIHNIDGDYVETIVFKDMKYIQKVFIDKDRQIILVGLRNGSNGPFHVYDEHGSYLMSFGQKSSPSDKLKTIITENDKIGSGIDADIYSLPAFVNYDYEDDELIALSNSDFVIEVFVNKSKEYRKFQDVNISMGVPNHVRHADPQGKYVGTGVGYVGLPVIAKAGEVIYCFFPDKAMKNDYRILATYINGVCSRVAVTDIQGVPIHLDYANHIYCIRKDVMLRYDIIN